jgi:hypothetical protein
MSEEQKVDLPFWLVIVADSMDKPPKCIECKDQEAFESALKENVLGAEEELHAYAFRGIRVALGTPQPVGVYIVDGKQVQVGKVPTSTDASGRIIPLVPKSNS